MAKRTEGDVKSLKGTLYLVSTPIGNLEDITLRALRVLKEADVVAAEDTRHSLKLLNHFGISKPMVSYWGEKEKTKSEEVLKKLLGGESVALVSDAGTPGISDPGAILVGKAVPVPGPSALVTALSISGLSTEEFSYIGFLPSKKGQRQRKLGDLSLEPRTLVFFESPHRVIDTLIDMEKMLGNRKTALIKELTKLYEKVYRGGLSEILDTLEDETIAGEYVIIVEGKEKGEMSIDEAVDEVKALMKKGLGRKESVKTVASEYGISKKELYDRSLKA
jgi:16S rRNA (cytidine1402-2'-O)-methyltransferase